MTNPGRSGGLKQRMRCPLCRKVFATFVPSGGGEPRCAPHNHRPPAFVAPLLEPIACPGGGKFAAPAEPLEVG